MRRSGGASKGPLIPVKGPGHIKRYLVEQVQPIANRSGVNQESIRQCSLQRFLSGKQRKIYERSRSQRRERENDPSLIEGFSDKGKRQCDNERNQAGLTNLAGENFSARTITARKAPAIRPSRRQNTFVYRSTSWNDKQSRSAGEIQIIETTIRPR
jgi:hypothetical protein